VTRRLRVLSSHPRIGRPNDIVREFEGAQAFVDVGFAEWIDDGKPTVVDRSVPVETPDSAPEIEATVVTRARPAVVTARRKTG
jgi:putative intracellular protease/amidase